MQITSAMDPNLEIRKLPPGKIKELSYILDYADSWKRLMALIPTQLQADDFKCDVTIHNLPKYHSDAFKIIEEGGITLRRSCSEILFDEWGTSGRIRAKLGHLKYLLTKAELFRAADTVADWLGEEPPARPSSGPAAKINIHLTDLIQEPDPETVAIERHLDEINYPRNAIEQIKKEEQHEIKNHPHIVPKIVVSEVRATPETFQMPLVIQTAKPENDGKQHANINGRPPNPSSNNEPQGINTIDYSSNSKLPDFEKILPTSNQNSPNANPIITEQTNGSSSYSSESEYPGSQGNLPDFKRIIPTPTNPNNTSQPTSNPITSFQGTSDDSNSNFPDFDKILPTPINSQSNNMQPSNNNSPILPQYTSDNSNSNFPDFDRIIPSLIKPTINQEIMNTTEVSQSDSSNSVFPDFDRILPTPNQSSLNNQKEALNNAAGSSQSNYSNSNFPDFDQILPSSNKINNNPLILYHNEGSTQFQIPSTSTDSANSVFPDFSKIIPTPYQSNTNRPTSSTTDSSLTDSSNSNFPDINQLIQNNPQNQILEENLNNLYPTKDSNPSAKSLSSVLSNLTLNSSVSHFPYSKLEEATSNFSSDKDNNRLLGAGGSGSVYLAEGLFEKPVAVKKMFSANQFKSEVEALCKYKHENVVSLLGYSCDENSWCLVYEYVPGGSLMNALQNRPKTLSWKQRMNIALGIAKGVAYLHTAYSTPLLHSDIKSANILLNEENNAKLCDFGISKYLPNQETAIDLQPIGTSVYMSPEFHDGEVSIKLDTFSFGVVLLELLTSLPPLDYEREGADLVLYVENECEDSIDPLLDKSIGLWEENGYNFADQLFKLSQKCLSGKDQRPLMVEVVKFLDDILTNISS